MISRILLIIPFSLMIISCRETGNRKIQDTSNGITWDSGLVYSDEKHFRNIKQLTLGGDNAEAYWSFDDSKLVFQSTNRNWGDSCDQIYYTSWKNSDMRQVKPALVSTGKGRTTCSYFLPGDSLVLYASTHLGGDECPPRPAPRTDGRYVWPIYSSFDIFVSRLDGTITSQLTDTPGYDAEATLSPKGDKIVFTSIRSGDLELYTMNIDGTEVRQVTDALGYDGGAFFSPDGNKLVFRASRPSSDEDIRIYRELLNEELVMPTRMELFTCNTDGSELKQVTSFGGASWCPFFHPSGQKIIFASNHESQRGFPFNLYLINIYGTGLERITHDGIFDAFPVFSNDGKYLVFSSNRNNQGTRDTNLFVAEWID
ncbi:MAG TPA: hypothetical protein VI583_15570 [Cyclobacteriaceae bacterium]|nr:hypothetical protein [Cyclobacteriaceae bacterium]